MPRPCACSASALVVAAARWEAERSQGELQLHTPGTAAISTRSPLSQKAYVGCLTTSRALTLRVLTDQRGRVQTRIVTFREALLRRDMAEFSW
jgi:hypothetical protein